MWALVAYVPQAYARATEQHREALEEAGFPLPQRPILSVTAVRHGVPNFAVVWEVPLFSDPGKGLSSLLKNVKRRGEKRASKASVLSGSLSLWRVFPASVLCQLQVSFGDIGQNSALWSTVDSHRAGRSSSNIWGSKVLAKSLQAALRGLRTSNCAGACSRFPVTAANKVIAIKKGTAPSGELHPNGRSQRGLSNNLQGKRSYVSA